MPQLTKQSLGQLITTARDKLGFTRHLVEKKTGIPITQQKRIEEGQVNFGIDTLMTLVDYYEMDISVSSYGKKLSNKKRVAIDKSDGFVVRKAGKQG